MFYYGTVCSCGQEQHSTTIERWLKVEREMGENKQQRDKQRKELLAILDVLEWVLRRLRDIATGD